MTPPSYFAHANTTIHDGFGDASFLVKYRFVASNEEHGNYVATAFLGTTIPTGSYANGALDAVVTPTIGVGKGWRNFDIQTTVGVGIPVGDMDTLGTPVLYNTAFQYRVIKKLWPELEVNATFFPNGSKAGNKQVFLSPRIDGGKIPSVETARICRGWWYSDRDDTLPYVQPQYRTNRALSFLSLELSTYDGSGKVL